MYIVNKAQIKRCLQWISYNKYFLLSIVLQDPVIKSIATRIGCTPAQVCIAFALAKGLAVVTKTEKETRMKENLESINVAGKLTQEDIQLMDTLNKNLRKFWDVYAIP